MAQRADQFRRSDVVLWGSVAVVAAAAALVAANLTALEPQGGLAALHNSRAVAAQARELTTELAALDGSKSSLSGLADTQRQLQASQQQLAAARQQLLAMQDQLQQAQQQASQAADALGDRLTALEKTVAAHSTQLTALAEAAPRQVKALKFEGPDPTTITGAIDAPAAGFTAAGPAAPRTTAQRMPTALPAPVAARAETVAAQPEAAEASGPQWREIAALPAFASPAGPVATDPPVAPTGGAAVAAPPYPMAPRPAAIDRPAEAPLALESDAAGSGAAIASATPPARVEPGAMGPPPARRAKADIRAIGVAIGNPVTAAAALASWQQIAAHVGVLLVGTSPLLAADPAGSTGKVLVAGPIPSIAAAATLCGKIEAASLSCTPMPYVGAALGGQ